EIVDDALLAGELEQVACAGRDREAPGRIAEHALERNIVAAVDLGADVMGITAEAGEIGAEAHQEAAMRIDLAVAVVERQGLADLRQQRAARLIQHVERGATLDVVDVAMDER